MPITPSNLAASVVLALVVSFPAVPFAAPNVVTIQTDQPGARINPAMWGIFFEDINLGADGGLYAELVKNRSFEFPNPMMGWGQVRSKAATGELSIHTEAPFHAANPHYLRITATEAGGFGVVNEGFRGIGVTRGATYDFSVQVRAAGGQPTLRIALVASNDTVLATAILKKITGDWTARTATLRATATEPKARFIVRVENDGTVDLDMVSLFPRHTWKNRPGGMRADMVQKLADLKPGFFRFPGGCIVEGNVLTNRYQWKNTIGPIAERKLLINRWNFEFKHRPTPDYYQTFGLGFFEYFQLCEDIGAAPMPILSCGLACQFNSGEQCSPEELNTYIQDAIDLIEFANGPVTSTWGAKRAALGHPAPFNLKMIGIGNENWGQPYLERYARFHEVLKAKHPEITLISSSGPSPNDQRFHYAWPKLRELNADIVDEHCYDNPKWFFENVNRFDRYDRKGPQAFFGEYAAQSHKTVSVENRNNLECAIAEAAFMTGMERNAEVVRMASYAPLFGHEEGWQWRPNLIWVDNLRIYGTPNYYVQQLFARNRGDVVLPVKLTTAPQQRLFASATRDEARGEVIVKVVNGEVTPAEVQLNLSGWGKASAKARVIVLTGASQQEENTFTAPKRISPKESALKLSTEHFTHIFPPNSLTVLRIK
jgi:alpha-N-arabinofuranosidase